MWLLVTFFARFSLRSLFVLFDSLYLISFFLFLVCTDCLLIGFMLSRNLALALRGKGYLPACLTACCCSLPTDVANLRLLFTIIQSIIQFNSRSSRPESQFIQLFMHCAGGTGQVRYSLSFSQLFFTCFFSVYLSSSLRIFFRSVALSLYTSSSSFTGPQMRHKIFLQLRMYFPLFDTVCGCIAACVCVCVRFTCGELCDAANIRVLYTFSSFKTVSIRPAAALLLHSPVVKIDARSLRRESS